MMTEAELAAFIAKYLADSKAAMEVDKQRVARISGLLKLGIHPPEWMIKPLRQGIDYQSSSRRSLFIPEPQDTKRSKRRK